MPTYARGQIVVEDMVGVYHCIARCVRRTFLCGIDLYTGQDYSHRKEWILDRLRDLAQFQTPIYRGGNSGAIPDTHLSVSGNQRLDRRRNRSAEPSLPRMLA